MEMMVMEKVKVNSKIIPMHDMKAFYGKEV